MVDMGTRVTGSPANSSRRGSCPSWAGGTRWTRATSWPRSAIARASRTTNDPVERLDVVGIQVLTANTRMAPI